MTVRIASCGCGQLSAVCTGEHFRFCGTCGATVAYAIEAMPGVTAIPIGAFAEPGFPPPEYSVYEDRKHHWLAIVGENIEYYD